MEHERSVHSLSHSRRDMRTCWVIDHPAHFQLFYQWISSDDILIVTERQELDAMLAVGFDQPILRVERVIGRPLRRLQKGWRRQRQVTAFLFYWQLLMFPVFLVIT